MFIKRSRLKNMEALIGNLQEENKKLKAENKKVSNENVSLRNELEDEHLENCQQHRKLFKMKQALSKPYGTYKDLLEFRDNIRKELSTTLDGNR